MNLFILILILLAIGPSGLFWLLDAIIRLIVAAWAACIVFQCPSEQPGPGPAPAVFAWHEAFKASELGVLSAVWGSSASDVFIVGGKPAQGEIYHFDGTNWRALEVPPVPLLIWVFGFAPDDVIAVGVGGGVVRYDGLRWSALDSGTTEDLWGVWGRSPDDLWIVGGTTGRGGPELIHFDGSTFTPVAVPDNDRAASSLFKVFGIGERVFAVGENGLIIGLEDGTWIQFPAGDLADDDFVSLWGTSDNHLVAVGGRASARIAVFDGNAWNTIRPEGVPGLNGVFMPAPGVCYIGGINGFVGSFNVATGVVTQETSPSTPLAVHALWAPDDSGLAYAVGGRFNQPYQGLAFVRTDADPGEPALPLDLPSECATDDDCPPGRVCAEGGCTAAPGCAGGDSDGDGWLNSCDTCPTAANPLQEDSDLDGVGDACDACPGFDDAVDSDGDGAADGCDICPSDSPDDTDGDDVCDSLDRCPGFSDAFDGDGDGVPNACDACPNDNPDDPDGDGVCTSSDACKGFDDALDSDGDNVPDGCDACPLDNPGDSDLDGVCDSLDLCPGSNDALDSDGDGVPNGCDACAGDDDMDTDGDGVPDACDLCPGQDDGQDGDGDGAPDGCDPCPNDHPNDSDGDGVCDSIDACPGFSDFLDTDVDGVPNGCDACPADNPDDSDGDGACNSVDVCPGFDDTLDTDGDGVPDGCDACPNDHPNDSDGDGVCDSADLCPGFNDHIDSNGNGVPDGCCIIEADCPLGQNCGANGICAAAVGPDLEFGAGGGPNACLAGGYQRIDDGGLLHVCEGFQGLVDCILNVRVTGFSPGAQVTITAVLTETGVPPCGTNSQCGFPQPQCQIPDIPTPFCLNGQCTWTGEIPRTHVLTSLGGGVNEAVDFNLFVFGAPDCVDGKPTHFTITMRQNNDPAIVVTREYDLVFSVRRRCFPGVVCPSGQPCVSNFCQPN